MKYKGLTKNEVEESRRKYGTNTLTEIPPEPLWRKILHGFSDPMIMILMVALVIQLVLYFMGQSEWYEPVGVLAAIMIANCVAAISEHKQENKAAALKSESEAMQKAMVIREGELEEIHISQVVVGDLVYLQTGNKLPADGEIIDGELKVDQACLNGETEEADKVPNSKQEAYDIRDLLNIHYGYRGTVVTNGEGLIEIKEVGDKTLFGQLALEAQEETRQTPLQVKLEKLAQQISTFGYVGATAIVLGILAKTIITGAYPPSLFGWVRLIISAVTVAVTVIVCAVPEGLPMLTSILLSLQSFKMAKDNVLVRKIRGLETSGSLSILFSDKTGTITEGRLTVAELALGNLKTYHDLAMSPTLLQDVKIALGTNNSANSAKDGIIGGNSTDRALMEFLVKHGGRYQKEEILDFDAFNSTKKSSTVWVMLQGEKRAYTKGAPEVLVEKCVSYLDENGQEVLFKDKQELNAYLLQQANRAMRVLAAVKETANGFCLICTASIRDNVRSEAAAAIMEVQKAGVQVVMVTGDRRETAAAIAKEANLITDTNNVVLTSSELNQMSDDEVKAILPKLSVVARALPTDKSRLVRLAQDLNYVVGMTGDGVNDSPALKKADVGFAMGSGTEAAKEAGDITILDDNFASIEKAILYGRTMFKSIRKFLIFQLTVNVAAVAVCFLGPMLGENVILTVIQLLLINLAMDTLAAMAYGGEPALKEFMLEKPIRRDANIVTKAMGIEVLCSAFYITIACLAILFFPPVTALFGDVDITYLKSAVFATFMMAITFNGFNARTDHVNVFANIGGNVNFLLIMLTIFMMQFVFVTFGGEMLSVESLSPASWLICGIIAVMVIPLDMLRKCLAK